MATSPTGSASAEPRVTIEADSSLLASRNPFLLPGDDDVTLAGEVVIRPKIAWQADPGTEINVEGDLALRGYHRRFGTFVLGRAVANVEHRRNEFLTVDASASFGRELPAEARTPTIDAAFDTLSVREAANLRSGLTWTPDARTTVATSVGWERVNYRGSALLDRASAFDTRAQLSRRTGPHTTLGVQLQYTSSRGAGVERVSASAVRLVAERHLSERWRASVSGGVERSDFVDTAGRRQQSPLRFSGTAEACYEPQHLRLCGGTQLRSVVSGFGGLQREMDFSLTARKQVAEHAFVEGRAYYTHARLQPSDRNADVARASLMYERRMSGRLWVRAGADYLSRTRFAGQRIGGATLRIGVTYRGVGQ